MSKNEIVPVENISDLIRIVRGQKVIFDRDLAKLYEVETRALNQAVRRNTDRFPEDFMFRLNADEYKSLISQNVTSKPDALKIRGGRRKPPFAFTEQGIAMLSSVLNSPRAIQVNIAIMRAFVRLRGILSTNKTLAAKLADIETKMKIHDKQFKIVFEVIGQLMSPIEKSSSRPIGFGRGNK